MIIYLFEAKQADTEYETAKKVEKISNMKTFKWKELVKKVLRTCLESFNKVNL